MGTDFPKLCRAVSVPVLRLMGDKRAAVDWTGASESV